MSKHIQYNKKEPLSAWRKVSLSSWKPRGDSAVYAFEDIVFDDLLKYSKLHNLHIHTLIVKALSIALYHNPRVNSTIRFGKIYNRSDNSIFVHVLPNPENDDLTGYTITNAHSLNLHSIQTESELAIETIQNKKDPFTKSKNTFAQLPQFGVQLLMNTLSFILFKLNIHYPLFNVPKNPFGSIMLTSVGSLGMQQALCPIAPYTNNSMVVSIGKIRKMPVVIDNVITQKEVCTMGFTFDHRLIDGIQFKRFFEAFTNALHEIVIT